MYPYPILTLEQKLIYNWFQDCQHQWQRVVINFAQERRIGIPFSDAKAIAETIGLRLNTKRLKLFNLCVRTIVNDDIDAINIVNQK